MYSIPIHFTTFEVKFLTQARWMKMTFALPQIFLK
jgi:hypothetical protein